MSDNTTPRNSGNGKILAIGLLALAILGTVIGFLVVSTG